MLLAAAALPLVASAQQTVPVRIVSTPELIRTLYAVTHAKDLGKHNLSFCNKGQLPAEMPPEMILQSLPDLPVLDVAEALVLMRLSYDHNWKFTLARNSEYAMIFAGTLASGGIGSGLFAISTKGLSKLIAGIGIAHLLGDRLKGEVPKLDEFIANTLNGPIQLGPAGSPTQCAHRVVFTGVIHGVHGYDVTVLVPVAPGVVNAMMKTADAPIEQPKPNEQPKLTAAMPPVDPRQLVAAVSALSFR